jgi:4-oxalmesaconate hydratase
VDPRTWHNYDDTKRYIDQVQLKPDDEDRIYSGNARRVLGRLGRVLKERGLLS